MARTGSLYCFWLRVCRGCHDPENVKYPELGGRGISVCPEWRENFDAFSEWAHENGHGDNTRIVRKNLDGDFCPENCEVVTKDELNRRLLDEKAQQIVQYKGESFTVGELCEKSALKVGTLHARIFNYGWPVEEAVDTPLWGRRHKRAKNSEKT